MIRRLSLAAIFASVLLIGAAYALAFIPGVSQQWNAWLMVVGIATIMVAMSALGALQRGSDRGLGVVFVALFLILVFSFGAALILPAEGETAAGLWLGLPPRAAVVIYGVGLLPLFVLPLAYALTFRDSTQLESEIRSHLAAHTRAGEEIPDALGDEGRGTRPVGSARFALTPRGSQEQS